MRMLNSIVTGSGEIILLTEAELFRFVDLPPARPHPYHRSVFVLLPATANHTLRSAAATYSDNPTKYLTFGHDHRWLATHLPNATDELPQHLLVLNHPGSVAIARHELTHAEDFSEIYNYALERLGPGTKKTLLIRMSVFLLITELRAYALEFRLMPEGAHARDLVATAALILEPMIEESRASIPPQDWDSLLNRLGVKDLSRDGIVRLFRSNRPIPSWKDMLDGLGPDVVQELEP